MENIDKPQDVFKIIPTNNVDEISRKSGIYFICIADEEIIYVGQAKDLLSRCKSYSHYFHINPLINIRTLLVPKNKLDVYEKRLIKLLKPKLNQTHINGLVIPKYPVLRVRMDRDFYTRIINWCGLNNVTIADKTRELWSQIL